MNSINLLIQTVDNLWWVAYSIIVGWGASFTIVVALLIIFTIKLIKMNRRITMLENRLVSAERDYNLTINQWESK
jgi:cell division protein FtsX